MAEKVDACWSCRFYKPFFESGQGACRRHAPMLIDMSYVNPNQPEAGRIFEYQSAWPMMGRDEWCGDFEVRRAPVG